MADAEMPECAAAYDDIVKEVIENGCLFVTVGTTDDDDTPVELTVLFADENFNYEKRVPLRDELMEQLLACLPESRHSEALIMVLDRHASFGRHAILLQKLIRILDEELAP